MRYYYENIEYERRQHRAYCEANRETLLAKQRERDRIRRAKKAA